MYYRLQNIKPAVKSIIFMLLLCFCTSLTSQNDSVGALTPPVVESRSLDIRVPEESKIEEFKKDPRFNYETNKRREAAVSWWDRLWFDILDFIGRVFSSVASSGALSFVVIVILVLAICLLLMKLMGVDYRVVLGKKKIDTPEINIYTDNVHEMNFDVLISGALKNKDYRLAIRFIYLKNLKLLSDREIITWNPNKTNYSYQNEINNSNIRSKFLEATLIFDYVWYGEFPVEETGFYEISSTMNDLSNMIANER